MTRAHTIEEYSNRSAFMSHCLDLIHLEAETHDIDPSELSAFFDSHVWELVTDVVRREIGMCASVCCNPLKHTEDQRIFFGGLMQGLEIIVALDTDMKEDAKIHSEISESGRPSYGDDPIIKTLYNMNAEK